jgi:hypothetical protein
MRIGRDYAVRFSSISSYVANHQERSEFFAKSLELLLVEMKSPALLSSSVRLAFQRRSDFAGDLFTDGKNHKIQVVLVYVPSHYSRLRRWFGYIDDATLSQVVRILHQLSLRWAEWELMMLRAHGLRNWPDEVLHMEGP